MAPTAMAALLKRYDAASATSAVMDLVKRQSEANSGLPTLAIVLLAFLGIILAFGIVAIIMHSRKRDATVPDYV